VQGEGPLNRKRRKSDNCETLDPTSLILTSLNLRRQLHVQHLHSNSNQRGATERPLHGHAGSQAMSQGGELGTPGTLPQTRQGTRQILAHPWRRLGKYKQADCKGGLPRLGGNTSQETMGGKAESNGRLRVDSRFIHWQGDHWRTGLYASGPVGRQQVFKVPHFNSVGRRKRGNNPKQLHLTPQTPKSRKEREGDRRSCTVFIAWFSPVLPTATWLNCLQELPTGLYSKPVEQSPVREWNWMEKGETLPASPCRRRPYKVGRHRSCNTPRPMNGRGTKGYPPMAGPMPCRWCCH